MVAYLIYRSVARLTDSRTFQHIPGLIDPEKRIDFFSFLPSSRPT